MNLSLCIKPAIAILLFTGLFINNPVFGNPGIGYSKTFVIQKDQYPASVKKYNPAQVYVLYSGSLIAQSKSELFLRKDTIFNFKIFTDSLSKFNKGYRLIFQTNSLIDSIWQLDINFRITDKAYNLGKGLLKILAFDESGKTADEFIFNYRKKYADAIARNNSIEILPVLVREYTVYNSYDRNTFSASTVWCLSIGINKYKGIRDIYMNCESDATAYNNFFKQQNKSGTNDINDESGFKEYLLTGNAATKKAILNALADIASKASSNDYFIFNFSGSSRLFSVDSLNPVTYFFPYDSLGYNEDIYNSISNEALKKELNKLISLNILQEYIQQIPADKQLFISEAGPSEKFKTEFTKVLMQNSPAVASLLNKNRVIIVPNGYGADAVRCNDIRIEKGPINYYITSLDPSFNIYELFDEKKSDLIAYQLKSKQYTCKSFGFNYFDVFFEKKFLNDFKDIIVPSDNDGGTRGLKVNSKEIRESVKNLTAKHYALVVGTDNYKGKGWNKLSNPVKDARAVADELSNSYGFEVQLLEDKPMDTIYKAILEYYKTANPNDQLVIYFAGHGDVDESFLSDGFIVCSDSKSADDDPVRNSYIPYAKLQKMLNNIPARQILVLLDVCHGGTFDAKAFTDEKREGDFSGISNKNVLQFLKDKLPLRTRKFLSSVGSEPAFDGKAGRHSPFANLLLQVLRAKGSGSNGIVTLTDINAVLQKASLNETASLKISPHMADFGSVDAFTEFVFIPIQKENNIK
jgi:hypothetical protein